MTDAELIKAVAEGVMGWEPQEFWFVEMLPPCEEETCLECGGPPTHEIFNPINNANHRDMVFREMEWQGFWWVARKRSEVYEVGFKKGDIFKQSEGNHFGRTSMEAALAAVEAK